MKIILKKQITIFLLINIDFFIRKQITNLIITNLK